MGNKVHVDCPRGKIAQRTQSSVQKTNSTTHGERLAVVLKPRGASTTPTRSFLFEKKTTREAEEHRATEDPSTLPGHGQHNQSKAALHYTGARTAATHHQNFLQHHNGIFLYFGLFLKKLRNEAV
jgi:hypothetical protein